MRAIITPDTANAPARVVPSSDWVSARIANSPIQSPSEDVSIAQKRLRKRSLWSRAR